MKRIFLIVFLLKITACKQVETPRGENNLAYKWGKIALELTANDTEKFGPRPTVTARYLGLIFTAIFDAWSRFDETALPVYLTGVERVAVEKRNENHKEIAISYAAFRAMNEYFYSDSLLLKKYMLKMGFDPNNTSLDPNTPEGIGNLAAKSVIEARKKDGSNQYGTESGAESPKMQPPFWDYTQYQPVNTPDKNTNINKWQPKYFADGKGGRFAPTCLTPFWGRVQPFSLKIGSQFRPPPPPYVGSEQLEKEVAEVVSLQAALTNEQKALVEFMRDGPKSVQQAGHWLMFAQDVSVRDKHTLDEDVKMYFLTEITAMDAFIAAWDAKIYYDFARPFALVHHYFKDKRIQAWGGEGKGTVTILGQNWRPYSPETFVCPAFPSYVSGHSCVSGACGEALRLFKQSDVFGKTVRLVPGAMTEPNHLGDTVTILFPTFTQTANMAGFSRVLGGYHIQADNVAGLDLGRKVAQVAWENYNRHLNRTVEATK
jgi:PAP2 superfamily